MKQTRKAKGRDDFVHVLRHTHRTEIRKVTEKVVLTEVQMTHQNFAGKSPPRKANRPLCVHVKKGSCQKGKSCNYWHVAECAKFKTPAGCKFGDLGVSKHTEKSANEQEKFQQL